MTRVSARLVVRFVEPNTVVILDEATGEEIPMSLEEAARMVNAIEYFLDLM